MDHSPIRKHRTKPPRVDRSKPRDKRPWRGQVTPRRFWFE